MFLIAFLSLKQAKNEGELCIVHGKPSWSSNTWRIQALELRNPLPKPNQECKEEIRERNLTWTKESSRRTHLEYFLESILYIPYIVSKLGKSEVQRFKRCANRSWNEEVMAIGRQPHQAKRQFRKLRNHKFNLRNQSSTCEMDNFNLRHFCKYCLNLRNPPV